MTTLPIMPQDYTISTDPSKLDVAMIYQYLSQESYWARGIPLAVVQKSIDNAICFGVYHHQAQVGFARVVTDKATFAYLADVFILPEHRGKGLSKLLMKEVMEHAPLQGLRRWLLATRDAHALYQQFGWTSLTFPERFMHVHHPDLYTR